MIPQLFFFVWAKWAMGELSEYMESAHTEEELSPRCMNGRVGMTNVGTTLNNFIIPALPVRGLPISQN